MAKSGIKENDTWFRILFTLFLCLVFLAVPAGNVQAMPFNPAVNYGTGNMIYGVAVGDFDGDGAPDLAVTNFADNNVSILLGNGDGTFAAAVNYPAGTGPNFVAVGDFNGDGDLDLAVSNYNSHNVSILLGNGDGTFAAAVNYAVGSAPISVAVGDFNGDTNLDLAVSNWTSNNVSILLGNGAGAFAAAVNYPAGTGVNFVAVGDFNGDTNLDLAVPNFADNNVSILLGNGDGTFAAAVNYAVGTGPTYIAVGDFNGDTNLDLAVSNWSGNNVSILLGNGAGAFAAAVNYAVGTNPWSVAVGDFNGDTNLDMAVVNNGSNNVSILLGNGDGTFAAAVNYAVGSAPRIVAVGDFNSDSAPDLAVTNFADNNVSILLNTAPPTPPTVTTVAATGIGTSSATLNMTYTLGNYSAVDVRFAYKKSADASWSYTPWVSKSADGAHSAALTGLDSGTQYDFKAQLKYGCAVIEGNTLQFTTGGQPLLGARIVAEMAEGASAGSLPVRLAPPNLQTRQVSVSSGVTRVNQTVTVAAEIVNEGETPGSTNIALVINGFTEQVQTIRLEPGAARTVEFTVQRDQPGKYEISVGDQRASFLVVREEAKASTANNGLLPILLMGGLFLAVIVILVAVFRKRPTY